MVTPQNAPPEGPIRQAAQLEARLVEAVQLMVTAIAEEVPYYGRLAPETLHGEIADVCRRNLRCACEGRPPTERELVN